MKESVRTLDQLPVGGSCVIEQVGNQRGAVKRRLIDMGLTPGTVVKLIKTAPLGDPMEVQLRGYELSLRKADAAQIQVLPAGGRAAADGGGREWRRRGNGIRTITPSRFWRY